MNELFFDIIEFLLVDLWARGDRHLPSAIVDMAGPSFFGGSRSHTPINAEHLRHLGSELDQFGLLCVFGHGEELDNEVSHFVLLS